MNILTHSITSTPTDGRLIQDLGLNVYRVLTVSDSAVFTVNVCCNIIKHVTIIIIIIIIIIVC